MTLEEFLPLTNENIALLILKENETADVIEYTKEQIKNNKIDTKYLKMEVMGDPVPTYDCLEIWIR